MILPGSRTSSSYCHALYLLSLTWTWTSSPFHNQVLPLFPFSLQILKFSPCINVFSLYLCMPFILTRPPPPFVSASFSYINVISAYLFPHYACVPPSNPPSVISVPLLQSCFPVILIYCSHIYLPSYSYVNPSYHFLPYRLPSHNIYH